MARRVAPARLRPGRHPWAAIKFLGIRLWVAVVIALFGFWLSHTFLAPAIESGTRSGVGVVNGTDK